MVVIRLARAGAKKNPYYHLVVADKRARRDGRHIEQVGQFNPMARGKETRLALHQARIDHWVNQGAQLSERVLHLVQEFKKNGGNVSAIQPTRREQKQAQTAQAKKAQKIKATVDKAASAEEAEKQEATSADSVEAPKAESISEQANTEDAKSKDALTPEKGDEEAK